MHARRPPSPQAPLSSTLLLTIITVFSGFYTQYAKASDEDTVKKQDPIWYDSAHKNLADRIQRNVQWFDSFFSDERIEEFSSANSFIRLKNTFKADIHGNLALQPRAYADIHLPKFHKKLRLIILAETEEFLDGIAEGPIFDPLFEEHVDVSLRYLMREHSAHRFHFEGGVKAKWTPDPFVQARYRYTRPVVSECCLFRYTQTVFWRDSYGFGESSRADYEKVLSPRAVLRLSASGTYAERSDGLEWGTEAVWLKQRTPKTAISVRANLTGHTRPENIITNYFLSFRYRHQYLREWLYYEVEPFIQWPEEEHRKASPGLALSLEVQLGEKMLKKHAPASLKE